MLFNRNFLILFNLHSIENEKEWKKKLVAMEDSLTLNARHAKKEKEVLQTQLSFKENPLKEITEIDEDLNLLYLKLLKENKEQNSLIIQLKDRCAWQSELEQVRFISSFL